MTRPIWLALTSIAMTLGSGAAFAVDLRICTSRGAVDVELDEQRAPLHAANFVRYAESGFYDGTILHRAVPGSMVQGGSYTLGLERRTPGDGVRNESGNGLSNARGTIAASRSDDPDSATSQFFFNLADNTHLDARPGAPGYTVFGRVTAGLQVLDAVSTMPTRRSGNLEEVPQPLVEVESVAVLDRESQFGLSIEPDPAALRANLESARSRGDAAGVLEAIDGLRQSCIALDPAQRLAEAEAAAALGLNERSRYARERYAAAAGSAEPPQPVARALPGSRSSPAPEAPAGQQPLPGARTTGLPGAGLPGAGLRPAAAEPVRDLEPLVAHCRRPVAPSVPDGRFAELRTMQALEGAVLRYRQLGETYLDCIARVIGNQELSDAETIELTGRHNDAVVEITAVMMQFNRAARTFKTGQ